MQADSAPGSKVEESGLPTSPDPLGSASGAAATSAMGLAASDRAATAQGPFTCADLAAVAVRFGEPGFVDGVRVGLFVRYEDLPPGDRRIEIVWDEEDGGALVERHVVSPDDLEMTPEGEHFESLFEHRYGPVAAPTERRVRVALRLGDEPGECVRVRRVVLRPAAPEVGGGASQGGSSSPPSPPAPTTVDLSITGKASSDTIAPAGNVDFTATVDNLAPSATATGVQVNVMLLAGFTFLGSTSTCSASGTVVTCDLADIPSGGQGAVTVTALAPAGSVSGTTTVSVTSTETDRDTSNNSAGIATSVR